MAEFNEAKFRSAAKAAGYSDEEIDAELKGPAPAGSAPAPSMDDTFAEKEKQLRQEYDKKVKQATTTEVSLGDNTFSIPTFFTSPAGIVTAVGAGIGLGSTLYGAGSVAPKVYQSIKDRWMTKTPEIDRTIDIPLEATPSPTPNVAPTPLQQTNLTPQEVQARADRLKAAQVPAVPATPAGAIPPAPAPEMPVSTPMSAAPVDAPAPMPTAGPNSPVTSIVTDTVKEMIQETPAQPVEAVKPVAAAPAPVAAPAYPKTGTKFKTEADIPPGFVARYDVGNVDRSMGNILGLEHRAYARDLFNKGLPFGQSANQNQVVSDLTKQYFQQLQGEIPETILGREARQAQKIPSDFGVFANKTNFGKGVTIGGKAATLFALADVANAQTAGQRGMAGANLLEAILPPGFMMGGAGEGSGAVPSVDAAMLLGSPYAQSELAKKRRQEQEYVRKVGAGRGIAPPSAYQR